MVLPVRIQLSRAPGFRLQEHSRALNGLPAAKVDRTTRFGNPYRVGGLIDLRVVARWGWTFEKMPPPCADACECVMRFESHFRSPGARQRLRSELRGMNLACWCALTAEWCHADVELKVANE
jgi:hypothetical protein